MTKFSLPIKRADGSILIEPLLPVPYKTNALRSRRVLRLRGFNNTDVQREAIFRDIAILVLLAITIIAGSAVLIGIFWRDVAIADSQARIIEAEQAAQVRLAEAELMAATDERSETRLLPIILGGAGITLTLLALARPKVIVGR